MKSKEYLDTSWIDFQEEIYDWDLLNNKAKKVVDKVLEECEELLTNNKLKEKDYHKFLSNYAGFFLAESDDSYQVISKLKLGTDYETDFVVIYEGFTAGILYEIIEIDAPHTKPFTKNGQPSFKLTNSIQQILNWERWLQDNRRQFSDHDLPFSTCPSDTRIDRVSSGSFQYLLDVT
jgi:hypothetical protein